MHRLVTVADVDEQAGQTVSVSALLMLELADGARVPLLDGRGWGSTAPWAMSSVEEVEETTRMVVGPDEPPEGRTHEEEEEQHWAYLHQIARRQGITVDAHQLSRLPHDVMLTDRLRRRLGRSRGSSTGV